ncbi:MAG: hypothetical protein LBD88_02375 [Candidatus Peribacteria bacterium]|jgi:hypothetical protein|nr:hypothetical protein [Candidatus Peribacteria bacterium]
MSLKLLITPLAEKKFDVFFRYLEDDYKRKYDALLFFKDEIILANEKDLNKLVYDIYNAINEKFNSEIIAKKIVKE